MKNLVRGGVVLLLTGLFVVLIFAQTRTDADLAIAKDSQPINKTDINSDLITESTNVINSNIAKATAGKTGAALVSGMMNKGMFSATAYCLKGRTALGGGVRRGIVAADPRVLRLGSRINVSAGSYSGTYVVSDTGSRVRGRTLDIWVPSCGEAVRFGRRSVGVSVIN